MPGLLIPMVIRVGMYIFLLFFLFDLEMWVLFKFRDS